MEDAISALRSFNRFFTRQVGALDQHFLGLNLSLAEARLLFEIANAQAPVATDLQASLGMDAGYVSRILRRFEVKGWIERGRGVGDARRRPISLTSEGQATFQRLDERQQDQVVGLLNGLDPLHRRDLATALGTVRLMLGGGSDGFTLRPLQPGEAGLIAARQSMLYRALYGWGTPLEIIENEVVTGFLRNFTPGRERCWVADIDGVMAGSVFLTDEDNGLSRLRLLYVEPFARGRGIGDALVRACVDFARDVGYQAMTLWTHTVLTSARRIYAAHGFKIVSVETHRLFGDPVEGETWRLNLQGESQSDNGVRQTDAAGA